MAYNNYSPKRRRSSNYGKSKKKFSILPIILLLTLMVSIPYTIYTQVKVMKMKTEYNSLIESINKTENENIKVTKDNEKLLGMVKQRESEYKTALANAKIAYFTFDDGPSDNTLKILDTLDKYGIKATWFVNGHPGLEHLYKEIADRGHVIANHTFSHDYSYVYRSVENFKDDVNKLNDFIKQTTGQEPNYLLRYPGGSNNQVSWGYGGKGLMKEIIKEMDNEGYVFFDWNIDSSDASAYRQPKEKIVNTILRDSKYVKKANILMHDTNVKTTTMEALPEVIEGLIDQGFIFEPLTKNAFKPQFSKIPD